MTNFWELPCAAKPFISYRYRLAHGYIMIGAMDDNEALREAQRSTDEVLVFDRLDRWNGEQYVPVKKL